MIELILSVLIVLLICSNLFILWLWKTKKPKVSKEVEALQRAVAAFEVQGQSILQITRIAPESVFLRSTGRG